MRTDIFPYAGWVQREDSLWAKCKHPLEARQVTGGSFDAAQVICVACGVADAVIFHNKAGDYRAPPPPKDKQAGGA